jgi:mono/diheme cytochrome c family protein
MKALKHIALLALPAALLWGCGSKHEPGKTGHAPDKAGVEYAPQMYESIPLDPYRQTDYNKVFKDKKNAQAPVAGTIARGKLMYAYPYPNTNDGYERAGKELQNPLPSNLQVVTEGKRLYALNCQHCHGEKGNGQGPVAAGGGGKFAGVPAYWDPGRKEITEGKIFHVITYGKNLMGSHASQLNPTERWMVVRYVQLLQNSDGNAVDLAKVNFDAPAAKEKPAKKAK